MESMSNVVRKEFLLIDDRIKKLKDIVVRKSIRNW